jgi:hypothetical protein
MDKFIYIDFEGFMEKPPSLIGEFKNNKFTTYIFSETLIGIPNHECKNCSINIIHIDLSTYLKNLITECKENNKKIVAFSERELKVFKAYNLDEIEKYYVNAHREIKTWFRKDRIPKPKPFSLNNLLTYWEYPTTEFGNRQTTQRIRSTEQQLAVRENDFSKLTNTVKIKWSKVMHYNRQDVEGLKFIFEKFLNSKK